MKNRCAGIAFTFGLLLMAAPASANCDGLWEVAPLTRAPHTHLNLINQGQVKATVSMHVLRRLHDLNKRIDRSSGIYTRFFLCGNQSPNAFADAQGGANVVGITTGMVSLVGNDWDIYAAILGHENAHLTHRHGTQRVVRKAAIGVLELLAIAAVGSITEDRSLARDLGIEAIGLTAVAFDSSYSREEELEADATGMQFAHSAGFDPNGAIRLHRMLNTQSDFLSSHPSSSDRISQLQYQIAALTRPQTSPRLPVPAAKTPQIATSNTVPTETVISRSGSRLPEQAKDKAVWDHDASPAGRGVVLSVKERFNYIIATQTDFGEPIVGMRAAVEIEGKRLVGHVERVVDGYFSVLFDEDISETLVAATVLYQ